MGTQKRIWWWTFLVTDEKDASSVAARLRSERFPREAARIVTSSRAVASALPRASVDASQSRIKWSTTRFHWLLIDLQMLPVRIQLRECHRWAFRWACRKAP